MQWVALAAVIIATVTTIAIWEGGRWDLGLRDAPVRAISHFALGVLFAVLLIGAADVLIIVTTPLRHGRGNGFPFAELATVYLPAVVHEELLFRGYPFQKLWRWRRWFAVLFVSALFAVSHAFNDSVTPLALVNVFLGGVLLSLAYGIYERLWLPIGLHLAWNLMSGPVLGYSVSGWIPDTSLFTTVGVGSELLSGGGFGIEGSILMTLAELVAIGLLFWKLRHSKYSSPLSVGVSP